MSTPLPLPPCRCRCALWATLRTLGVPANAAQSAATKAALEPMPNFRAGLAVDECVRVQCDFNRRIRKIHTRFQHGAYNSKHLLASKPRGTLMHQLEPTNHIAVPRRQHPAFGARDSLNPGPGAPVDGHANGRRPVEHRIFARQARLFRARSPLPTDSRLLDHSCCRTQPGRHDLLHTRRRRQSCIAHCGHVLFLANSFDLRTRVNGEKDLVNRPAATCALFAGNAWSPNSRTPSAVATPT